MDAHPVPQNVTDFQFHLIGDMTLRQFLYLAIGVGIAYVTFIVLSQPAPVIAWPIIVISSLIGVAFAFLPIADRPLDHWLKAYLKAIFSPTKRAWKGNMASFTNRLNLFSPAMNSIDSNTTRNVPAQPTIQPASTTQVNATKPPTSTQPQNLPTPEELNKTVELAHKAQELQVEIIKSERELNQIKTQVATTGSDPKNYTQEFNGVFNNLQKLVTEAQSIKQQLSVVTNEPLKPADVKIVIPPKPKPTQLVLTTFPNVINGIITDAVNNYLEGVVVVIHDKDRLPVRALKTNKLGQFTGSTPLPNGTYTIELEKEGLVFDILQIELTGKVLPPLTIAAKRSINT
jgi:hypothetical protein